MGARVITVDAAGVVERGACGEPGCVALHADGSVLHIDADGHGWYAVPMSDAEDRKFTAAVTRGAL